MSVFDRARQLSEQPQETQTTPELQSLIDKEKNPSAIFDIAKESSIFQEPKESFTDKAKRHTLRLGARAVEKGISLPGRISEAPINLTLYVHQKITGKP